MKSEKIYDSMTDISEEIITRVQKAKLTGRKIGRKWWTGAVAAVLIAAMVGAVLVWPGKDATEMTAYALAQPEYPEMSEYPDENEYYSLTGTFDSEGFSRAYDAWRADLRKQQRPEGYADGLGGFFASIMRQFLSADESKNVALSPVNVYMALGMLAEITDGSSRQQILDLIGSDTIEELRAQASDVWNVSYRDDGAVASILANSVWLDEGLDYERGTVQRLSDVYYASAYQGDMQSEEFIEALREWLNEQTGGLLEEQAAELSFSPSTVLSLASTVYFRSKWSDEFSENATRVGQFHTAGGDVSCEFMHQSITGSYYWADSFSAVGRGLESGGKMWFLLPDEGVTAQELLSDRQTIDFILSDGEWENRKLLTVNQVIPKFDIASQMDLCDGLKALGVTDIFDSALSDYTPITSTEGLLLSHAQHDVRVMIDEEGCSAAAYTVMMVDGMGMPPEDEVDFVVDRPFIFAITGIDGLPLFVGVVNRPIE